MLDYNGILTALKVAEQGSFVGASGALKIPTSTVSARVQALERCLGVKLFHRSTRRVRLTEAGQAFFEPAKRGREAFEDSILAASRLAERPSGLLRVVAPTLFARNLLPNLLPRFLTRYPDLRLAVDALNVLPSLGEHGADVGIGVGPSRTGSYLRRSLFSFSQAVYASPQFVARWGNPQRLSDLEQCPLLGLKTGVETFSWELVSNSRRQRIKIRPRVVVSDISAIHGLVLAGVGAALLPEQMCAEEVDAGKLVRILRAWSTPPVEVSAYYPHRQLEPVKVKVFLDYIIEWFTVKPELVRES